MYKIIIFFIFYLSLTQNIFSKTIKFDGLSKLTIDDIQQITSIDIKNIDLSIDDINILVKELLISELIYEVDYIELDDFFSINNIENDLIKNIFINNNVWIKDELIIQNLKSKVNSFLSKNKVQQDIALIESIYKTKGFQDTSIIAKVERFSNDRVNLIYDIKESEQQKINIINFLGNDFYSNNYLNSLIKSQSIKFYNIFKSGSNLNYLCLNLIKIKF